MHLHYNTSPAISDAYKCIIVCWLLTNRKTDGQITASTNDPTDVTSHWANVTDAASNVTYSNVTSFEDAAFDSWNTTDSGNFTWYDEDIDGNYTDWGWDTWNGTDNDDGSGSANEDTWTVSSNYTTGPNDSTASTQKADQTANREAGDEEDEGGGGMKRQAVIGMATGLAFVVILVITCCVVWKLCCGKLCDNHRRKIVPLDFRSADHLTSDEHAA